MSIKENVAAVKAQIEKETNAVGDTPTATLVREAAIKVILGGPTDWINYMRIFAKTPAQLARLIPMDGTENNEAMNRARAYLVSNGPCNPDTHNHLDLNIGDILDEGLEED